MPLGGFATITEEAGAAWVISGANSIATAAAVYAGGALSCTGALVNAGSITGFAGPNKENGGTGITLSAGTLDNTGSITGGAGFSFANANAATNGGAGVYVSGGTLTNAGTITGGAGGIGKSKNGAQGDAVQFGGAAATLVVDAGAVFGGNIAANTAVNDVLQLAGGTAGTLAGLGSAITGFTTITESVGGNWSFSGASTLASGSTLSASGSLAFLAGVSNSGVIDAAGLISVAAAITGTGTLQIASGATLSLTAGIASTQTVDFLATSGLVDLNAATSTTSFAGTFSGFAGSDQIDLINSTATTLSYASGVLTVDNGSTVVAKLHFTGNYTNSDFSIGSDSHGGSVIKFV